MCVSTSLIAVRISSFPFFGSFCVKSSFTYFSPLRASYHLDSHCDRCENGYLLSKTAILTPTNLNQVHRRGVFGVLRVVVEAAARFAAVQSRQNHALQQWWRGETLFAKLIEHDLGDVVRRIEPNEISESKRTHRI